MTDQLRIGQVIDALVGLAGTATGYRLPQDVTSADGMVTVFDGPEIRSTDDAVLDGGLLVIGWSGSGGDDVQDGASAVLAGRVIASTVHARDETSAIVCMAIYQSAGTPKEARDGVIGIFGTVANLCRTDPTLGLSPATFGGIRVKVEVTAGTLTQYLDAGYNAEFQFTITYNTRV
jgi:hypothetical protein